MSAPSSSSKPHAEDCENIISTITDLYLQGPNSFYSGFEEHLPQLRDLYNQRGAYEQRHSKALPRHAVDAVTELYKGRQKLPDKQWRVDWELLGRALDVKETGVGSSMGGQHGAGKGAGAKGVKGASARPADRDAGSASTAPPAADTKATRPKPRPRPLQHDPSAAAAAIDPLAGYTGPTRNKPSELTKSKPPPTVPPPPSDAKAKQRIKSKAVVDSDGDIPRTLEVKAKVRDTREAEEQAEREKTARVKGKSRARVVFSPPPSEVGGGLSDADASGEEEEAAADEPEEEVDEIEEEAEDTKRAGPSRRSKGAAPLTIARRRRLDPKPKVSRRLFKVFGTCGACDRAGRPCTFDLERVTKVTKGTPKVACDGCKNNKHSCGPTTAAALSFDSMLGEYEEEMFGKTEEGEEKTVGDLFIALLLEQRATQEKVTSMVGKVDRLSTGLDTSPQHSTGLTDAITQLTTRLAKFEKEKKLWDEERKGWEKEKRSFEDERRIWELERKELEAERKEEHRRFVAAADHMWEGIADLKGLQNPRSPPAPPPPVYHPRTPLGNDDDSDDGFADRRRLSPIGEESRLSTSDEREELAAGRASSAEEEDRRSSSAAESTKSQDASDRRPSVAAEGTKSVDSSDRRSPSAAASIVNADPDPGSPTVPDEPMDVSAPVDTSGGNTGPGDGVDVGSKPESEQGGQEKDREDEHPEQSDEGKDSPAPQPSLVDKEASPAIDAGPDDDAAAVPKRRTRGNSRAQSAAVARPSAPVGKKRKATEDPASPGPDEDPAAANKRIVKGANKKIKS